MTPSSVFDWTAAALADLTTLCRNEARASVGHRGWRTQTRTHAASDPQHAAA